MPTIARLVSASAFTLLLWGCGDASSVVVHREVSALTTTNGVSLNGVSLNGVSLNGVSLNGVSLNGVSLNGVSLNGVALSGATIPYTATLAAVKVDGSQLVGVDSKGTRIRTGSSLVGAKFNGVLSNGKTMKLRIDAVHPGASPNADVWSYDVSYLTDQGWFLLCGASGGAAIPAIPMMGKWDASAAWQSSTSELTFACHAKAIAKCVLMGYKPWLTTIAAARDHHQACTRLLRADYCGTGQSYTVDGTPINLYDDLGIQVDTEEWSPEAEWTASGAACVGPITSLRMQLVSWLTGQPTPACILARELDTCGTLRPGTLLVTEYGIPQSAVDAMMSFLDSLQEM